MIQIRVDTSQSMYRGYIDNTPAVLTRRIMAFYDEVLTAIGDSIRDVLGTSEAMTLSAEYSAMKVRLRKLKRIPGKQSDQPLILTGQGIYDALKVVIVAGGGVGVVGVPLDKGMSRGFDYAEHQEKLNMYIEKGIMKMLRDNGYVPMTTGLDSYLEDKFNKIVLGF